MSNFGKLSYWFEKKRKRLKLKVPNKHQINILLFLREDRYSKNPNIFEFYNSFDNLSTIIKENIPLESKILYVGSGTSCLYIQI